MASPVTDIGMKYRFLGDTGLLVSTFGLGFMVQDEANFDKTYGGGNSERVLGKIIKRGVQEGVWTREDLVLTTKLFFGTGAMTGNVKPNNCGLSRKHIIEGTKASLKRMDLEYVDVLYCHRPEPFTPLEEVVRAMNFAISQGWAFYWGTSEWLESDLLEAWAIADRLGLVGPIVEQPQYNIQARSKVEVEYASLLKSTPSRPKMGLATWSPLRAGMLTGKYANGMPEGSRLSNRLFLQYSGIDDFNSAVAQVEKLRPIAEELGCSVAQLALAWCATNESVSSVLLGATSVKQLEENLEAFPFVSKITPEIKARIEAIAPLEYITPKLDGASYLRQQFL